MRVRRTIHLVILAHIWACVPFMLIWSIVPGASKEMNRDIMSGMLVFAWISIGYLAMRTVLALKDPDWLPWEKVFPPIDVLMISIGLYIRHDADSVFMYGYLIPIAESLTALNIVWATAVGAICVVGAFAATYGQPTVMGPLSTAFRFVFMMLMASLLTLLARIAAAFQSDLSVATDRTRIALEMHDGVQGQLIAIASQLEVARCVAPKDGAAAAAIASGCRDLARKAADDLRFLVHRLRSPSPAQAFVPALQQYINNMGSRGEKALSIQLEVRGEVRPLPSEVEHALFRIVQESLTNVLKHAEATRADVLLEFAEEEVRCAIRDDGKGFDSDCAVTGGQLGLASMRDRASLVNGVVTIESQPGAGTTATITAPCKGNSRGRSEVNSAAASNASKGAGAKV